MKMPDGFRDVERSDNERYNICVDPVFLINDDIYKDGGEGYDFWHSDCIEVEHLRAACVDEKTLMWILPKGFGCVILDHTHKESPNQYAEWDVSKITDDMRDRGDYSVEIYTVKMRDLTLVVLNCVAAELTDSYRRELYEASLA